MLVLAECVGAGSARTFGILAPPLLVLAWSCVVFFALRGAPEQRLRLFASLLAGIVVGALFFAVLRGDSDENYVGLLWISVGVTAAIGALNALLRPRVSLPRSLVLAIAGDVFLPGAFVLLLIWALSVTGTCLD